MEETARKVRLQLRCKVGLDMEMSRRDGIKARRMDKITKEWGGNSKRGHVSYPQGHG